MKVTVIQFVVVVVETMIGKGTRRLGTKKTGGDHPDYIIIKIDQNT